MYSETPASILPEPPEELKSLSGQLASVIHAKIAANGPIPFSDYMEMALYEPGLGYYSAGLQKFGEGGDFVTAPQIGDVFARCLSRQVEQVGTRLCQETSGQYEIVEVGAGSGQLAADLLRALEDSRPPRRYRILERSAHLRQVQEETLRRAVPQWMDRIQWLDEPPAAQWHGILLANEVLDALTVERFCIETDRFSQLQVANGPDGFEWHRGDCPVGMKEQVRHVLDDLEQQPGAGFCSEINTKLSAWLKTVTASLGKGVALFIDYGYTRHDYYQPQRSDGTLICHYRHRAHGDPFIWPGLTDISASVDFTALAEAADFCELEVCGYTTQAMFLLACGLDELLVEFQLLSERDRLKKHNQVRHLTLPGEMGERFQVMALGRGLDEDLSEKLLGFSMADYCHKL
jgi:SAM-dependent MidA family methyltransferase